MSDRDYIKMAKFLLEWLCCCSQCLIRSQIFLSSHLKKCEEAALEVGATTGKLRPLSSSPASLIQYDSIHGKLVKRLKQSLLTSFYRLYYIVLNYISK